MGPRAIEPQAYVIVVARATGQAHGFVGLPTNNPCANGHSDIIQELMGKLAHGLAGPPRLSTQGPKCMYVRRYVPTPPRVTDELKT